MILVILALALLLPSIPAPAAAEPYILPSPPQPDGVRIDIGLGIEPFVVCESWWWPYGYGAFDLAPELAVPLLSYDLPAALGLERQPVFGAGPLMLEPYREGLAFNDAPVCDAFVNSLTIVGARWVRYSPKGRVEVTNAPPAATRKRSIVGVVEISGDSGPILYDAFLETRVTWDPLEPAWWLTAGRLPWELLSGLIQVGDSRFIQRDPPAIPIVGDPDGGGVTYAALAKATKTQSDLSGILVIDAQGNVSSDPSAPDMSYVSAPDSAAIEGGNLPHSIPTVFWDFLQQPGWVATDLSWVIVGYGRSWRPYFHYTLVQAPQRIPWLWLVGLPITDPYWTRAKVGGVERWILVQCFERRCLSYTPDNPDPWKVEFTNTGLHYYQWRYGEPWNPDQYRWTEADFAPRDTYRRVPQ